MIDPEEHPPDRIDRNWTELLQELRVAQTGVQILTAFLLTVPFAPGFDELDEPRRWVFAGVLWASVMSVLLLMTPVALHRQLFRQGKRPWLVQTAHQLARVGLGFMAVAQVGSAWLVLGVVVPGWAATMLAATVAAVAIALWLVLPRRVR